MLFDVGFGIYDQEYTELYQPDVLNGFSDKVWNSDAIRASQVYAILDNGTQQAAGRLERAGRPLLAASDLLGFDVVRDRLARVQGRHGGQRGQLAPARGVHGRRLDDHLHQRHPEHDDAAAADRSPEPHQGRRRHLRPGSLGDGARDAQPRPALRLVPGRDRRGRSAAEPRTTPASSSASATTATTTWRPAASARSRTGRTSRRASGLRSTCSATGGRRSRRAWRATSRASRLPMANANNPVTALGLTDERPWTDTRRQRSAVRRRPATCRSTSSGRRISTPTFGRNISTTRYDDGNAERLVQARIQLGDQHRAAAPALRPDVGPGRLFPPQLRQPDVRRRPALRPRATTMARSASPRRPMRICRTAAATRFAGSTT